MATGGRSGGGSEKQMKVAEVEDEERREALVSYCDVEFVVATHVQ